MIHMVVRVGDEVMWHVSARTGYAIGRVTEVRYEAVRVLETGRPLHYGQEVPLNRLRVRRPVILTGDVVAESTLTGRVAKSGRQGVVQPVRMDDGHGWVRVLWERGSSSRHRPADLFRVPAAHQHPELWPSVRQLLDA